MIQLTPRETEVLAEVATGANNRVIADRLTISIRAVENYCNLIFHKLELTNRPDTHSRVMATLIHLGLSEEHREVAPNGTPSS